MLGEHELMAFTATRDPARAMAFYRDVLGLTLVADEPFALVFDARGMMLRIQIVPHHVPLTHTALGWNVSNMEQVVDALSARGVSFERYTGFDQDARGVWMAPGGTRVAWFKDPDGNVLSLTQFDAGIVGDGRVDSTQRAPSERK